VFNGTSPNGTWSLWVVDDEELDAGSISAGWELIFEIPKKRRAQVVSE
jgi:subtilisin-like proprotein convertase family protein